MSSTRMEARIDVMEMELKKIPEIEGSLEEMTVQMGDMRVAMDRFTQRFEELMVGTKSPTWTRGEGSSSEANRDKAKAPIEVEAPSTFPLHRSVESLPATVAMSGSHLFRRVDPNVRKMELPLFEGKDAESWIYRAEHYFELHHFSEEAKLRAVKICLSGPALIWLKTEERREKIESWLELRAMMLNRFRESHCYDLRERFFAIKQ